MWQRKKQRSDACFLRLCFFSPYAFSPLLPPASIAVLQRDLFLLPVPPFHLHLPPHHAIPLLSRRSLTPPAPTTPTQGSPEATWRPSTKWRTSASTSARNGTQTTLSPQKSPWRTRWVNKQEFKHSNCLKNVLKFNIFQIYHELILCFPYICLSVAG